MSEVPILNQEVVDVIHKQSEQARKEGAVDHLPKSQPAVESLQEQLVKEINDPQRRYQK